MDGEGQRPQKKLMIHIPAAMAKAVQARSIAQAPSYDPPVPPPPLPNPVFPNDHVAEPRPPGWQHVTALASPTEEIKLSPSTINFDDELELMDLDDIDEAIEEWFDALSTKPLYLVRYDIHRLRYLTFCECSRKRLISKYLAYILSDATTAEYTTIRSLSATIPVQCIKQEGQLHTLLCSVQQCQYVESQLSVAELTVKMLVHHIIAHQKESTWYQRIDRRVKGSFEEALKALEEELE